MPVIALSRWHLLLVAVALLALLAVAGKRLAATGATEPPPTAAAIAPVAPAAPARILVHVVGAVRRPGLYQVREGARVADAVARAGGAGRKADLASVNLAAPVVDGTQVVVPVRPTPGAVGAPARTAGPAPKVSLGSATLEQLDELPGIGPVTAQKIIDHRAEHGPFGSVDDLDAVPGIGPATVEELRDLVTP